MSEEFSIKASFIPANKEVRGFLARMADALEEDDSAALRVLVNESAFAAHSATLGDQVALAFGPDSETIGIDASMLEKLLGVLEESRPYLLVSGSQKKLTVKFNGADQGTDVGSLFLLWLNSLGISELNAAGQGFTWKAKWVCHDGIVSIKDYVPLCEGQVIDPKADEKQKKRQAKENKQFLQSPFGFLVEAIENGCGGKVKQFVATLSSEKILDTSFSQLFSELKKQPVHTGASYRNGPLEMSFWRSETEEIIRIDWYFVEMEPALIQGSLTSLAIEFLNDPRQSDFSGFEWAVKDIAIEAEISDSHFKLIMNRLPWAKKMDAVERAHIFIAPPCHIGAYYWQTLYEDLAAEAQSGNASSLCTLAFMLDSTRPGCPRDCVRSEAYFVQSASLGNDKAMYALGQRYARDGTKDESWPLDVEKAKYFLRMGKDKGHEACIALLARLEGQSS
ncbi:tetratricopeptide repeat protein [Undibacterium sp. Di26W]|uniref:tetratricopeptide repeat protein n=1 Tax=Undibacterium sp. Di26W TaxID=3413035 RepID=UPI003BF0033E